MYLVFGLLFISAALELSIQLIHPSKMIIRASLGIGSALVIVGLSLVWLMQGLHVLILVAGIVSFYRLFNIARIVKARMHERYLWKVTSRTSYILVFSQILLCLGWLVWQRLENSGGIFWNIIISLQLSAAIVMAWSVRRHVVLSATNRETKPLLTQDLPTLTVAIPARNESYELAACIDSLLASDYPKLEILVLDDCSQSPRTPEIIRSYAHKGVRFLQGREPQPNWLAKNQAYADLAAAASGEYLVFMGVDITVAPDSLRSLISFAHHNNKSMVCMMPLNTYKGQLASLIQPMRYVWELALPRKLVNRPPVLSSCWLIKKSALLRCGGFEAAPRMVIPEAYFAKKLLADNGYSFITSGTNWGVRSSKDLPAQRHTAVRVAYPQLHRRPEVVAIITILLGLWVISLAVLVVQAIFWQQFFVMPLLLCGLTWIIYGWMYASVLKLAYGRVDIVSLVSFPAAIICYVSLLHYSMYKYEFSEVLWKGRNICLPVMHVVPRLPEI